MADGLPAKREPNVTESRRVYRAGIDEVITALRIHEPDAAHRSWKIDGAAIVITIDAREGGTA